MSKSIDDKWNAFITEMPHHELPYSKKNWGNPNHSICSYQGKLKPSIAYNLVKVFVPSHGCFLDPFSGVGTIPFEGALNGRRSFGIDISPLAYYVSSAKVHKNDANICNLYLSEMQDYIDRHRNSKSYIEKNSTFGFNHTLIDYFHPKTFKEILSARSFIKRNPPTSPEQMLVVASLLHILHGNRPYALSRRSHPIVPYAPTGDFVYKNVIEKVKDKMDKCINVELPNSFVEGSIFLGDSTQKWDDSIENLDAIITSPPFFDSTRFYMANWIRLWFLGWDDVTFKTEPSKYVDERQKVDFCVYDPIFDQAKERLKRGGYFVMHLGKSKKCDMGIILKEHCKRWFKHAELYYESVEGSSNFGIKDLGAVTAHQYLIMH